MILMLEKKKQSEFVSKEFRPIKDCIKILNDIFQTNFNMFDVQSIHYALQCCPWIKTKTVSYKNKTLGTVKRTTLYYIGSLKKLIVNPDNYEEDYVHLAHALEKALGIELLEDYIPIEINNNDDIDLEDDEHPYDETNMQYCSDELEKKYQFESKRIITLTEDQISRLKTLLNNNI